MKCLDNDLLIRLLTEHRNDMDSKMCAIQQAHCDEQIALLTNRQTFGKVLSTGGTWLASARDWIQRYAINGDQVTWGSHEELRLGVPLTVRVVEELAAQIATATVNEFKGINEPPRVTEAG